MDTVVLLLNDSIRNHLIQGEMRMKTRKDIFLTLNKIRLLKNKKAGVFVIGGQLIPPFSDICGYSCSAS